MTCFVSNVETRNITGHFDLQIFKISPETTENKELTNSPGYSFRLKKKIPPEFFLPTC